MTKKSIYFAKMPKNYTFFPKKNHFFTGGVLLLFSFVSIAWAQVNLSDIKYPPYREYLTRLGAKNYNTTRDYKPGQLISRPDGLYKNIAEITIPEAYNVTKWQKVADLGISSFFDSDSDTGINAEENTDEDMLRFNTAGNERMTILNTGNVGIGITTPTQTLDVLGSVRIDEFIYDENNDPGTAGQILSTTGTGVDWINVPTDTDNQTVDKFQLNGNTLELSLEDDAQADYTVDFSGYLDNTDNQDLTLTGNTLSLTNDTTTVDLSAYLDNTDNQDLTLVGNTLSLTNDATTVDLSSYLDDTTLTEATVDSYADNNNYFDQDDYTPSVNQILAWNGSNWVAQNAPSGADNLGNHTATQNLILGSFGLSDTNAELGTAGQILSTTGTGVDWINVPTDTDNQTVDKFQLNGNTLELSLEDDAQADYTVDFSGYLDNTDNQDLTLTGNTLSLTNDTTTVDLSAYLDADNLGNHIATKKIDLSTFKLVGNGGSEGIAIDNGGKVGVGTATPASTFHNTGSTVLGAGSLGDRATSGNIGSAATTVDLYTMMSVNQSTTGINLTLPDPTNTTSGRVFVIINTGSIPFSFMGNQVKPGNSMLAVWNGSYWSAAVSTITDKNVISARTLADQTVNPYVNDSYLSISVNPNETWFFVISGAVDSGIRSSGFRAGLTAPAGATCTYTLSSTYYAITSSRTNSCGGQVQLNGSSWNSTDLFQFVGEVTTGTNGGTLQFQRGKVSSSGFEMNQATYMVAYRLSGADYAEVYYTSDDSVIATDLVSIDESESSQIRKSSGSNDSNVIGVVSTLPGQVIGQKDGEGKPVPVALSGRVPVKVSSENGPIYPGDYLVPSSTPGVAMKAVFPGQAIGQAITGFSGNQKEGKILIFLKNTYFDGDFSDTSAKHILSDDQGSFQEKSVFRLIFDTLREVHSEVSNLSTRLDRLEARPNNPRGDSYKPESTLVEKICIQSTCLNESDLKNILNIIHKPH